LHLDFQNAARALQHTSLGLEAIGEVKFDSSAADLMWPVG
jgi:hypothetical protein